MVARKGNKKDAAKPVVKKAADPLYPARPRNFRIGGDIRVKNKDLGRYVKWPRNVRIQRQRKILWQRLSVPPAINQFYSAVNKNQATSLFKLLMKYRPATDAEKTARRTAAAEKAKSGDVTPAKAPLAIKFGLKHVTSLIEEKRAKLVCIASDVEPIELVVWLPALCKKMGIPYCIVKNKARLGALIHQKTTTAICLTGVNKDDEATLRNLTESFTESFNDTKCKWKKPQMGLKTQARLEKRMKQVEADLAKKAQY
jgi:large subunit ribosomal protein L7Ae|uniref:60S ribosomal protein L7a n=1 Tax=Octactis speculum TaxID=3111310 RepID=A0A7S2FLU5_9STRA|mmetsp:Transcript_24657/g.33808  ORF Transcript_24657/g.33808 Transcript_24657/m.33808 type:complete len:256 (+) Transcript_24657:44-811(+)|eukprot:CAMPEP_0185762248 /NCGR_PEP_ID=MMETSP1174-20130828/21225_1 /TAXON_ID=35687 /ORGANISM="Dictyocha speculum, Strain CCMP1381" /LENGTH=255 /DNA_ID=CAMNT_0028443845 /DNA_START=62 /DNA_END=829 /DNA_ORIENTATION=+